MSSFMEEVEPEDENIIDLLLWISHGENVSSTQTYYKVTTPFATINFYSEPSSDIYTDLLDEVVKGNGGAICKLITGICPKIPTEYCEDSSKKYVYLPPLIFGGHSMKTTPGDLKIISFIGLHHFKVKQSETSTIQQSANYIVNNTCSVLSHNTVLDNDDVLRMAKENSITYSVIQSTVKEYCVKQGLNTKDILLGIYSCQTPFTYLQKFNRTMKSIVPKAEEKLKMATIATEIGQKKSLDILCVPYATKPPDWQPLARTKRQGCALNVLSYYGVLDENYAREKTVCLTQGTSIFTVVDYLDKYIKSNSMHKQNIYVVIRTTIERGLEILYNNWESVPPGCFVAFKLYTDNEYNGKYNEVGHMVSITNTPEDNTVYIDPQGHEDYLLDTPQKWNDLLAVLKTRNYHYMDIICTVENAGEGTLSDLTKVREYCHLRPRPEKLIHGGKRASDKKNGGKKTSKLVLINKRTHKKQNR